MQAQLPEPLTLDGDPGGRPAGQDVGEEEFRVRLVGGGDLGQRADEAQRVGQVDLDVGRQRHRTVRLVDQEPVDADRGGGVDQQPVGRGPGEVGPQVRGEGRALLRTRVDGQIGDESPGVHTQWHGGAVGDEGEGAEHRDPDRAGLALNHGRTGSSLIVRHACPKFW